MGKPDIIFFHAPSVYDFRKNAIMYGPVSDLVPSGPIFEMYPIGFATLAEYLERHGFRVKTVNLAVLMLKKPNFNVETYLQGLEARIFGIDLHWMPHCHGSIEIARILKRHHSSTPIIFGGYSSTYFADELLCGYPEIDFIMKGDSTEEPLAEFLTLLKMGSTDFTSVPNLSWRDKTGAVNHNPIAWVPDDIDHVSLNYRHSMRQVIRSLDFFGVLPFESWARYPITAALTCRGCTCACNTCGASAAVFKRVFNRKKVAYRDPEMLAADMACIQETIKGPIFVLGDIRQAGDDYSDAFLKALKRRRIKNQVGIEFFKPPPEAFFEKLEDALPHYSIEISVESHDDEVRRAFGKHYTMKEVEESIGHALKHDVERVDLYFMTGLPKQTASSVIETIEYSRWLYERLGFDKRLLVFTSPMAPFLDPGSEVYEHPERHGYRRTCSTVEEHRQALLQPSWKYTMNYESEYMTRDEQVDATYEAALGLNNLKMELGVIDEATGKRTATRIREARRAMAEIDEIMRSDPITREGEFVKLKRRMDILNVSTVCEKRELEWTTSAFNFRPLGIGKALLRMGGEYAKASIKSPEAVKRMFNRVAEKYDLLNRLLTLGLDQRWRRLSAKLAEVARGSKVLDACTGTGDLAFAIERLTGARVVGVDFSPQMLEIARRKASEFGTNGNLVFEAASVDNLPYSEGEFDAVTVGFGLRNTSDYRGVLKEFHRVTKAGGRIVCLEFSMPAFTPFRILYRSYLSTVVPFIGRIFADDYGSYKYLAESIKQFPVQDRLADMMRSVGWSEVYYKNLIGGIVAVHVGIKNGLAEKASDKDVVKTAN
ncbi:MAG: TIGR04190 family B12-binding domain/radical SAM domain protein [Actinobacteria bacterium]|nr:TIGR04190 family B12-binding domain/radical SAM domain protein [Actinomycetota bacterium]